MYICLDIFWNDTMLKQRVQNRFFKSRIPPLVLASSRHPATSTLFILTPPWISKDHFLFNSRILPTFSKLSRIPPIEMNASQSRQDMFIPYPALNICRDLHPASILCPIPHPAKPKLHPLNSVFYGNSILIISMLSLTDSNTQKYVTEQVDLMHYNLRKVQR